MSNATDSARTKKSEKAVQGAGILLDLTGVTLALYNLENPISKVVALAVCLLLALLIARSIHLWCARKLDPWLTLLTALTLGVVVSALFVELNDTSQQSTAISANPSPRESSIVSQTEHPAKEENPSQEPPSTPSASTYNTSSTVSLLEFTPTRESFAVGSANLNARPHEQALLVPFCFELGEPVSQVYVIDRKYDRLRALAGIADDSPNEIPLTFTVYGDGKLLLSKTAKRAGVAIPIDVSVKNVLRLELAILAPESNWQTCNPEIETFVWAKARLEPISS
jgi:hypothetical protein